MKQSIQEKTVSLLSSPKNRLLTVQTRHELRTSLPSRIQLYVDLDFSLIVWNYMEVLCVHCTGTCRTRRFLNMRVGYFDHWQGLDWWVLLMNRGCPMNIDDTVGMTKVSYGEFVEVKHVGLSKKMRN